MPLSTISPNWHPLTLSISTNSSKLFLNNKPFPLLLYHLRTFLPILLPRNLNVPLPLRDFSISFNAGSTSHFTHRAKFTQRTHDRNPTYYNTLKPQRLCRRHPSLVVYLLFSMSRLPLLHPPSDRILPNRHDFILFKLLTCLSLLPQVNVLPLHRIDRDSHLLFLSNLHEAPFSTHLLVIYLFVHRLLFYPSLPSQTPQASASGESLHPDLLRTLPYAAWINYFRCQCFSSSTLSISMHVSTRSVFPHDVSQSFPTSIRENSPN